MKWGSILGKGCARGVIMKNVVHVREGQMFVYRVAILLVRPVMYWGTA